MTIDRYAIDLLARKLLSGQSSKLSADELDALLSWLSGGQRHGALHLSAVLGPPSHCPQTVSTLYRLLDQQLLSGGELNAASAHIGGARPHSEGKARFRRLIQAFHPDRYPELSAWLTPRAQIIHQSYAAFKRGEPLPGETRVGASDATNPLVSTAKRDSKPIGATKKTEPHPWHTGPFRRSAKLVPNSAGPIRRQLTRLQSSPNLSRFIISTLAIIGLVPMLLLYWLDDRAPVSSLSAGIEGPGSNALQEVAGSPALREQHLPNRTASARMPSASRSKPDHMDGDKSAPQRVSSPRANLTGEAGAVAGEAQLAQLIQQLGQYITAGDIDGLYRLLEGAYIYPGTGMASLADYYHGIITSSRRRHQDFQILSIEHHPPNQWTLTTLSRLTLALDDLTAHHKEALYRVTIDQEADGQLRITGFDD